MFEMARSRRHGWGPCNFLPTIVLGRAGNIQAAVSPMKQSAFNFLEKPIIKEQVLALAVDAALRTSVHISGSARS
jgi:FixJ family two-component response regulator